MKALCLIGLQITDFNHKEHKDHKGLFGAVFVSFVSFVVNCSSLNYVSQARQRL